MSGWDSFAMVDWSSGNDRGPAPLGEEIEDRTQVRDLVRAIAGLRPAVLDRMLDIKASEEAWIFELNFKSLRERVPCPA